MKITTHLMRDNAIKFMAPSREDLEIVWVQYGKTIHHVKRAPNRRYYYLIIN